MDSILRSFSTIILISLLFFACGSSGGDKKTGNDENSVNDEPAMTQSDQDDIPESVMTNGEKIYQTYCMACHQTNGTGNPGMYPPLNETETVNGEIRKLVNIVLNGMKGEIEVKGEIYDQVMAPHNFLSDEQVADLLTYVRNSFGNSASMVTEEEVRQIRNSAF